MFSIETIPLQVLPLGLAMYDVYGQGAVSSYSGRNFALWVVVFVLSYYHEKGNTGFPCIVPFLYYLYACAFTFMVGMLLEVGGDILVLLKSE